MAPTIHLTPALLAFVYRGPTYDVQVFSRQELLDALEDAGNEGKTILVRAGDYGGEITFNARREVMTTVRAWPGDAIDNFGPVTLDASFLRVQGFDMSGGGFDTNQTGCHHIEILDNYIHDAAATGVALWAALPGLIDHDITIERNHFARLTHLGEFFQGYAIVSRVNDQTITNVRIAYNTMEDTQADGAEMAAVDGLEFVGNDVTRVLPPPPPIPDPHPDGVMLWAGTKNAVVKDNRFVNVADTLMGGSTKNVLVENNLIVHTFGRGIDGGATGTSDDALESYTFTRNTVYDCFNAFPVVGGPGGLGCVSLTGNTTAAGATNILDRNIFGSLDVWELEQFDTAGFGPNIIQRGFLPGPDDISVVPAFADLTDYLPVNMPAGYEDCGYRRVPCGHLMR